MPENPLQTGTGEVSLGYMVVIHEANTIADARKVAYRLEQEGIPALIQDPSHGLPNIPTPNATKEGSAFVVVPSLMQRESRQVLRDMQLDVFPGSWSGWRAQPQDSDFSDARSRGDRDLEPEMPSSGALAPRLFWATMAITFGVVLQTIAQAMVGSEVVLSMLGATSLFSHEIWRVVTAGFMHVNAVHAASNAAFGLLVGVVLFGTHRPGAVMTTWLVTSVVGIFAELLTVPGVLVVGASAGNYGLVGLWAHGQVERSQASLLPTRERLRTLGILLLLVPGALTPVTPPGEKVAVLAHIVGFVMGYAMGYVFLRRISVDQEAKIAKTSRVGFIVSCAVVGWAFVVAVPGLLSG